MGRDLGQTRYQNPIRFARLVIVLVLTIVLEITKNLDFSYVVYEKVNIADPAHSYFGQSAGRGTPEQVRARRDSFHERSFDHFPSRLRASIETRGMSEYAGFAMNGREQQHIDNYGGLLGNGGRATNTIRAVSRINALGYSYGLTSNDAYGTLAPFTGWVPIGGVPPQNTSWSVVFFKKIYP